jgi:hypothetical protein
MSTGGRRRLLGHWVLSTQETGSWLAKLRAKALGLPGRGLPASFCECSAALPIVVSSTQAHTGLLCHTTPGGGTPFTWTSVGMAP